ncbi:MAG: FAD-dependent oxidoreductase [Oscillospiraceae bacterium]|nr:FAD-dependent oxidoreductase [Oscillospiraceae bacterium]
MNKYYPNLAKPIKIAGLTFKNRIFGAPISPPDFGPDCTLTKENISFYGYRSSGGAASITVSEGIVHFPTGRSHTKQLALDNVLIRPSLAETARTIHSHGAFASIELSHGGKYAGARTQDAEGTEMKRYGPIDEVLSDGSVIHAMSEELIYEIADAFGKAAALVKEAGFDMVLVHAAHGWLLHQFMSPTMNRRTDKWGGESRENRMRFPLLVIEKIREAVGKDFPIEYRFSGAEFIKDGYGIEEGIEIAKAIDGKVDIIHVSAGVHEDHDAFIVTHPDMLSEHGRNVWLAAEIKKHVKTPVATLGGLNDPDMMEEIIASGKADIVELGRQLLCDPLFPKKALTGHKEDIVKCCRCFTCFGNFLGNRVPTCALNPIVGREREHEFAFPPAQPKNVVIAGGGPGGMAAALMALDRGHKVTLFEKNDRLGGALNSEEHVPFKADLYAYARQQEKKVLASDIDVRLGTELTGEILDTMDADVLVLAVGAKPIVPPIPGIDSEKVVGLEALHEAEPKVGQRVAVLGGGLVGTESAVYLAKLGKEVSVVEMRGDYAPDAPEMHHIALEKALAEGNVNVHLNTRAVAVTDAGLECEGPEGKFTIEADTILLAAGMRADQETVNELRDHAKWFVTVGDCVKAGKVFDAVNGGYYAALYI